MILFAGELSVVFKVLFGEIGPADVTSKWINEGSKRVRQLFDEAEAIGPCVIFLDEAEHHFGGRDVGTGGAHAEDRKITSEFLVHLTADDRSVIVVGATNRPEGIDPAILRPGRLATLIEIDLPEEESRQAIFEAKVRDAPHDLSGDELALIARDSAEFTGAVLKDVVYDAKRHAARRNARVVSIEDFPILDELKRFAKTALLKQSIELDPDEEHQIDIFSLDQFNDDSSVGFQ